MAQEIAQQLRVSTIPIPLPSPFLWTMCLLEEGISLLTRKARLLSLSKYPELAAPGWVCDPSKITRELGIRCETGLQQGIAETIAWYREHKLL
jgi:nucleoside-diphosphate-sugar epimerase